MGAGPYRSLSIRCLDCSQAIRHKVVRVWEMIESALAMGLIKDEAFTQFDTYPFDETKLIEIDDQGFELESWARIAVEEEFDAGCSVLVVAAGGLKEFVALQRSGFMTSGIEYGPILFEKSLQWLKQNAQMGELSLADRYHVPPADALFEAAFVARHYYSHIRRTEQRVEFLRSIREQLADGAPVILSYYICEEQACDLQPTFSVQQKIANGIRKTIGRGSQLVTVGDHIDPESTLYHHHFIDDEVASELEQAGFKVVSQNSTWFGWAVARAVEVGNLIEDRSGDSTFETSNIAIPASS